MNQTLQSIYDNVSLFGMRPHADKLPNVRAVIHGGLSAP